MLWGHSIFRFEISQLWRFVLVIQLARHYDVSFDKHFIVDFIELRSYSAKGSKCTLLVLASARSHICR